MLTASQGSPLTSHARARMQQRGIGKDALDLLFSCGREAAIRLRVGEANPQLDALLGRVGLETAAESGHLPPARV